MTYVVDLDDLMKGALQTIGRMVYFKSMPPLVNFCSFVFYSVVVYVKFRSSCRLSSPKVDIIERSTRFPLNVKV